MTNKDSFLESKLTRRNFISNSGKLATGGALAGIALPVVHGQSSDITKIALVGCGGRGTGAASNALSVSAANGPTKLVAMADVFQSKLDRSYNGLINKHKDQVDVPQERRFIGFDGYQKAMDVLSRRCRYLHLTLCIQVGALSICYQTGNKCIYGEAGNSGWICFEKNA